jgi:hypothetical protein
LKFFSRLEARKTVFHDQLNIGSISSAPLLHARAPYNISVARSVPPIITLSRIDVQKFQAKLLPKGLASPMDVLKIESGTWFVIKTVDLSLASLQ